MAAIAEVAVEAEAVKPATHVEAQDITAGTVFKVKDANKSATTAVKPATSRATAQASRVPNDFAIAAVNPGMFSQPVQTERIQRLSIGYMFWTYLPST